MNDTYFAMLQNCKRHADRLHWAKTTLTPKFPLTETSMQQLSDTEIAILDQFTTRFAKLQDAMGAKLFPAVLELTKEPGNLAAFLDKLNRLEKIGGIPSATQWLMLREMRNEFSHNYPDNPVLQAAMLNRAFLLADELLAILIHVEKFAAQYTQP